mmetsp:Transcript_45406/g.99228  ORF Transcript_45406/g.99228 Transcript_45406/m.99228 type:complete len:203 (+) Transcript_45406:40-648(+)
MEVYKDIISDSEYFSNAKPIKNIVEGKEEYDYLVYVNTKKVAVGGGEIDIGAGDAFGGAGDDEKVDDTVETMIDHLDQFPDFGSEAIPFESFKQFKNDHFKAFLKTLQAVKNTRGDFEEGKEAKSAFQERAANVMAWIKTHWDDLEFYQMGDSQDTPVTIKKKDGTETEVDAFKPFGIAYWSEGATSPDFVFWKDCFYMTKY